MADAIRSIELRFARVSPKTLWTFIEVETEHGIRGTGEATLFGAEAKMAEHVRHLQPKLRGTSLDVSVDGICRRATSLDEFALLSAMDQAIWDIRGQTNGVPTRKLFGISIEEPVRTYANINRRTNDRTPDGFAKSAASTIERGFSYLKIAPFDGVTPDNVDTAEGRSLIRQGLERVAAICDVTKSRASVMVDCHWRFTESAARAALDELALLGVVWYECPIPEIPENFDALRGLRKRSNSKGMQLAGCETKFTVDGFRPYIENGLYDIIMPDVKYAGGYSEILAIAGLARENGITTSLHNPTGPISHAASLQLSSLLPGPVVLEHQFDESSLFTDLIAVPLPPIDHGLAELPAGSGLGTHLVLSHPAFETSV